MIEAAKADLGPNTTALDGFDDLLDCEVNESGHDRKEQNSDTLTLTDWTPEQAAEVLGKSVRTIRRMLQDGTLDGYKVPGPKRLEWRVKPLTPIVVSQSDDRTKRDNSDTALVCELRNQIQELKTNYEQATKQLEGAIYRTGYLEAQLEAERQQVKLLMDGQHRSRWWHRIRSWFAGQ
jgi:excisionase family DNA binding protein